MYPIHKQTEISDIMYEILKNNYVFILGDIKSKLWGSPITGNNRAKIEELYIDLGLSVPNNGSHTYSSRTHGSSSTPNISLSSTCITMDCN